MWVNPGVSGLIMRRPLRKTSGCPRPLSAEAVSSLAARFSAYPIAMQGRVVKGLQIINTLS